MEQNKEKIKKIHIVGVGGAGMSAIALVLKQMGYDVSGSDIKRSRYVDLVEQNGVQVFIGHDSSHVQGKDLVIYSTAIQENNPEIVAAKKNGIRLFHRSDALKLIAEKKKVIAITGSHGKTTTTSLTAHLLRSSGIDAGFIVGGEVNDYGSNAMYGTSDFFVVEADESDGTFLKIDPYCSIFTNLEPEHLDYFKCELSLLNSAKDFVRKTKKFALVCADDRRLSWVIENIKDCQGKLITYGFSPYSDFQVVSFKEGKESEFALKANNGKVYEFKLKLKGKHNILNAASVAALGLSLGISSENIQKAFQTFNGVGRRLEVLLEKNGITVIDDYAHHPSEIAAVISTLKKSGYGRVIVVFQPHRYTRTYHLYSDFPRAFKDADVIVLTEIYSAGENPIPGVTGKLLFELVAIENSSKKLAYLPRLIDIPPYIKRIARKGDAVAFLGAGDITLIARETAQMIGES